LDVTAISLDTDYAGDSIYFVYYLVDACTAYVGGNVEFEYIDANFPWVDGYKPDEADIVTADTLTISTDTEDYSVDLSTLPP